MRPFIVFATLALAAALLAGGGPANAQERGGALTDAQREILSRVESYLNGIRTMRTDFTQIGPDGQIARGKIYLSRPGRMRLTFDPPHEMVMVATSIWLIIDDGRSPEPTYLPLRASPAAILIKEDIDLTDGEDIKVLEVEARNDRVFVHVADADDVEQGSVIMVLRDEPLRLVGWTVIDAQEQATQVTFANTETGIELDPDLFRYVSPDRREPFNRFEP